MKGIVEGLPGEAPTCPHCGSGLAPRVVTLSGRRIFAGWLACTCAAAQAEEDARDAAERADEARRAAAEDAWRLSSALDRARVPLRYRDASDAGVRPDAYVFGPVGVGKTHAACATAVAHVRAGGTVRFATPLDVAARVRSTYHGGAGDEDSVVSDLVGCDLLVLDDLGRERETAWSLALLWRVVDGRYGRMADTLVTSNYSRSELASRLASEGDEVMARAVVSRLAEMTVPVMMGGKDRRLA